MKCLCKDCVNEAHQGMFMGEFCTPCYTVITTSNIKYGTSFIHKLQAKAERFEVALVECSLYSELDDVNGEAGNIALRALQADRGIR